MAATHVVSLFLPNTISFAELPPKERRSSSVFAPSNRVSSAVDLTSRLSQVSLFNGPTPPLTPALQAYNNEEFFPRTARETMAATTNNKEDAPKRPHHARFGSRALIHSEVYVPDWGSPAFNQPRSRAGPLPSASIQDFAKVYEELKESEERQQHRFAKKGRSKVSPPAYGSRNTSSERGYEGRDWTVEPAIHGNGGLFNAISEACDDNEDLDITWIGTVSGSPAYPSSIWICTDRIRDWLSHRCARGFRQR